jgi:hypothetical protein
MLLGLLLSFLMTGCGKQNPVAPAASPKTSTSPTKKAQTYLPAGIIYSGMFYNGTDKPWYWFDSLDYPSYNARIRTNQNAQSADVIIQNTGAGWGKVSTFAIAYANTANANVSVRIFVPSHSSSCAWKIVIQEQTGQWRNWVLQDSTGYTGYKDYDLTAILAAVNAGSGSFTIELVVEGAAGQYVEVSELYVFLTNALPAPNAPYWFADWGYKPGPYNAHTAGWFDETTNPGFHATISNTFVNGLIVGDPTLGGKVESPIIPWKASRCQHVYIGINDPYAAFTVWIQEQTGLYRQWQVPRIYNAGGYTCDLSSITALADGAPFSVTISDVFGSMYIVNGMKVY